jgi:hypothetical protein
VFVMLAQGSSSWWAVSYGLAVGLGFLASPVVQALGVGPFGRDFGWHFAATVLTAHAAFGVALAILASRLCVAERSNERDAQRLAISL